MATIARSVLIVLTTLLMMACTHTPQENNAQTKRLTMVVAGDANYVEAHVKRVAWHPTLLTIRTANKMNDAQLQEHMRSALQSTLEQKGYQFVGVEEQPDMYVGFAMALESEISDSEILQKVGLVPGLSTIGVDKKFEKGSVLVALFKPQSQVATWQTLAQGFTEPGKHVADRDERFATLTQLMLTPLPAVQ
ncbi:DUF4136 domain-containing protein [Shewanella intestini]|uniref:DUF4136 domain-containing protein n=1 Tax=Shewanella intestini TaxID=2017544 RepID=A0ABS5HZ01_9GAMM|nr:MULTISPECIES: DUF4136 domain-containing protein [Shewanella]MBR9726876.1 DUF4136 domain-containing protein [Shewanella intestini]